ncbi:MAG: hypothetical protein K2W95_08065 [Candidatus Obscuribacterales bacterium]|nr:hypothetical protein [Candidatus Obscuribacterales bacterium]
MSLEHFLSMTEYSLSQSEKEALLLPLLIKLTARHRASCVAYDSILTVTEHGATERLDQVPMLPVGIFKTHDLLSCGPENVFTKLTSSGTSGEPSRIYLDRQTAQDQARALAHIMSTVLGKQRLPGLFIDSESVLHGHSARSAAVLGLINFARPYVFVLNDDMSVNHDKLNAFLKAHGSAPFMIAGMTFMIWQHLYNNVQPGQIDLSGGVLIHGGGWKKLQNLSVDNRDFKKALQDRTGLSRIYNFYGMVEQVGSVFLEGEDGFLYAPNFADVIVRNPRTLAPAAIGEEGLLQVISILPGSYPGHSLLTEDIGRIEGIDDSSCGRGGKRFLVLGRVPKAELRGCSDTTGTNT